MMFARCVIGIATSGVFLPPRASNAAVNGRADNAFETSASAAHSTALTAPSEVRRCRRTRMVAIALTSLLALPHAAAATLDDARQAFEAGRFERSLNILRQPDRPWTNDALVLAGRCYQRLAENNRDQANASSPKAFAYWMVAADNGSTRAAFYVGWAYDGGNGTQQDHRLARHWYRQAADAGHARAMHNLARLHRTGQGGPRNLDRALALFRRAAEQDRVPSMIAAADILLRRPPLRPGYEQAVDLYKRAARHGEPGAMQDLGDLYSKPDTAVRDLSKAYAWYALAREARIQQANAFIRDSSRPALQLNLSRQIAENIAHRLEGLEREMAAAELSRARRLTGTLRQSIR